MSQRGAALLGMLARPLLEGDALTVGTPLGAPAVSAMVEAVRVGYDETPAGRTLAGQRQTVLRELLPGRADALPLPRFSDDPEGVALLVVVHDVLAWARPETQRVDAVRRRQHHRELLRFCRTAQSALLGGDDAVWRILCRYSLLFGLFRLRRKDVVVESLWGKTTYRGQPPPRRVFGLLGQSPINPGAVREVPGLPEAVALREGLEVVRALLESSPLSDLCEPVRGAGLESLPMALLTHASFLRHRLLARLVIARFLDVGLPAVSGPIASELRQAFLGLFRRRKREAATVANHRQALATWIFFAVHLQLVFLERGPSASLLPDGAEELAALFAAFFRRENASAWPGLSGPAAERQQAYLQACTLAAGKQRLADWALILDYALRAQPASISDDSDYDALLVLSGEP